MSGEVLGDGALRSGEVGELQGGGDAGDVGGEGGDGGRGEVLIQGECKMDVVLGAQPESGSHPPKIHIFETIFNLA